MTVNARMLQWNYRVALNAIFTAQAMIVRIGDVSVRHAV